MSFGMQAAAGGASAWPGLGWTPGATSTSSCSRTAATPPDAAASWRENRRRLVASLIHEVLHTLGLGENPPSSAEITERVLRHCGET
jgi:hypothetical protein